MTEKTARLKQVKSELAPARKTRTPEGRQIELQHVAAPIESSLPIALQRMQMNPAHVSTTDMSLLQRTIGMRATQKMAAVYVQRNPLGVGLPRAVAQTDAKASLRRMLANRGFETTRDFESRLHTTSGAGNPIPGDTRAFMENSFQQRFDDVRLHTGAASAQLNEEVGARAFTHGRDIYLGAEAGGVDTGEGKHLLAHELTHVVQQTGREEHSGSVQRSGFGDILQRDGKKKSQKRKERRQRQRAREAQSASGSAKFLDMVKGQSMGMGGQVADTIGASLELGERATYGLEMFDTVAEVGGGLVGGVRDTVEGATSATQGRYGEGGLGTTSGILSIAAIAGAEKLIPGIGTYAAALKTLGGVAKVLNAVTTSRAITTLKADNVASTKPAFITALNALAKKIDMWTYLEGIKQVALGGVETGASSLAEFVPGGAWGVNLLSKGVDFGYSAVPMLFRYLGSYTSYVDSNTQVEEAAEQEKNEGIAAMGPAVRSVKDTPVLIGKLKRLALLVEPDYAAAITEEINDISDEMGKQPRAKFLAAIREQEGWSMT